MESHSDLDTEAALYNAISDNTPHTQDSSSSSLTHSDNSSSGGQRSKSNGQLAQTNSQVAETNALHMEGLQNIETTLPLDPSNVGIIEVNSQLTETSSLSIEMKKSQCMDGTQSIETGFPPHSNTVEIIETSGQVAETNGQCIEKNSQLTEMNGQNINITVPIDQRWISLANEEGSIDAHIEKEETLKTGNINEMKSGMVDLPEVQHISYRSNELSDLSKEFYKEKRFTKITEIQEEYYGSTESREIYATDSSETDTSYLEREVKTGNTKYRKTSLEKLEESDHFGHEHHLGTGKLANYQIGEAEEEQVIREHLTQTLQSNASTGEIVEEIVRVLKQQQTHDLLCPVCGSCVTRRVILRKRKRTSVVTSINGWSKEPIMEDEEAIQAVEEEESIANQLIEPNIKEGVTEAFGCLSCFAIFYIKGARMLKLKTYFPGDLTCGLGAFIMPDYPWGICSKQSHEGIIMEEPGGIHNVTTSNIVNKTEAFSEKVEMRKVDSDESLQLESIDKAQLDDILDTGSKTGISQGIIMEEPGGIHNVTTSNIVNKTEAFSEKVEMRKVDSDESLQLESIDKAQLDDVLDTGSKTGISQGIIMEEPGGIHNVTTSNIVNKTEAFSEKVEMHKVDSDESLQLQSIDKAQLDDVLDTGSKTGISQGITMEDSDRIQNVIAANSVNKSEAFSVTYPRLEVNSDGSLHRQPYDAHITGLKTTILKGTLKGESGGKDNIGATNNLKKNAGFSEEDQILEMHLNQSLCHQTFDSIHVDDAPETGLKTGNLQGTDFERSTVDTNSEQGECICGLNSVFLPAYPWGTCLSQSDEQATEIEANETTMASVPMGSAEIADGFLNKMTSTHERVNKPTFKKTYSRIPPTSLFNYVASSDDIPSPLLVKTEEAVTKSWVPIERQNWLNFSKPAGAIYGENKKTGDTSIQEGKATTDSFKEGQLPGFTSVVFPNYPWGVSSNSEDMHNVPMHDEEVKNICCSCGLSSLIVPSYPWGTQMKKPEVIHDELFEEENEEEPRKDMACDLDSAILPNYPRGLCSKSEDIKDQQETEIKANETMKAIVPIGSAEIVDVFPNKVTSTHERVNKPTFKKTNSRIPLTSLFTYVTSSDGIQVAKIEADESTKASVPLMKVDNIPVQTDSIVFEQSMTILGPSGHGKAKDSSAEVGVAFLNKVTDSYIQYPSSGKESATQQLEIQEEYQILPNTSTCERVDEPSFKKIYSRIPPITQFNDVTNSDGQEVKIEADETTKASVPLMNVDDILAETKNDITTPLLVVLKSCVPIERQDTLNVSKPAGAIYGENKKTGDTSIQEGKATTDTIKEGQLPGFTSAVLPNYPWGVSSNSEDMHNVPVHDEEAENICCSCGLSSLIVPFYPWGTQIKKPEVIHDDLFEEEKEEEPKRDMACGLDSACLDSAFLPNYPWGSCSKSEDIKDGGQEVKFEADETNEASVPLMKVDDYIKETNSIVFEQSVLGKAKESSAEVGVTFLNKVTESYIQYPYPGKESATQQMEIQEEYPILLNTSTDDITIPLLVKTEEVVTKSWVPSELQNWLNVSKPAGLMPEYNINCGTHPSIPDEQAKVQTMICNVSNPSEVSIMMETVLERTYGTDFKDSESLDILKSIVYGGLDISIGSFGVISSAAGGKSTTRTVVYMGFATLIAGLIMFFHTAVNLFHQNNIQYREAVGKTLRFNGSIAILSYLFFGMLAPLTYVLTFRESDDRDYKFFATAAVSLVSVIILSMGKAYVFNKSYRSTVSAYAVSGVLSSLVGYLTGQFLTELLEKWGLKDQADPE